MENPPEPSTEPSGRRRILACVLFSTLLVAACDRQEVSVGPQSEADPMTEPVSPMKRIDSPVYHYFADSPVEWRPWGQAALREAKDESKLIFCVLARPQDPSFFQLMEELVSDEGTVQALNTLYVPVLLDADLHREYQMLARLLTVEVGYPLSFPVFMWMDYEGNPHATTPTQVRSGLAIELFNQTHIMTNILWRQDLSDFGNNLSDGDVISRNREDHERRQQRIIVEMGAKRYVDDPDVLLEDAMTLLLKDYEEFSHEFLQAGAVLPSHILSCVAKGAMSAHLNDNLRERCSKVIASLIPHLLESSMIDPLDGGVFAYREGGSWQLPAFSRNSMSQIEFASALLLSHQVLQTEGESLALGAAERLIASIEEECGAAGGLFALAPTVDVSAEKWTWSTEEVREILGEEEARWWIQMTGMTDLGNVPRELPAAESLFRRNALALRKSPREMAQSLGMPWEEFEERLDAARSKLLEVRRQRLGKPCPKPPHLESSFAMVSLYALAHEVTADEAWKDKATTLHRACRSHFVVDGELRSSVAHQQAARAGHHAVALRACLALAQIAPESVDAKAITTSHYRVLNELHFKEGVLHECEPDRNLTGLSLEDGQMLFGYSTLGLLYEVDLMGSAMACSMPPSLRQRIRKVPLATGKYPLIHTDILSAALEKAE